MENIKRTYKETLQARSFVPKSNGIGSEWIPRIEKVYEFLTVEEFLKEFKPAKPTQGLINSISKAYNESGTVTFNCGNGNRAFKFNS